MIPPSRLQSQFGIRTNTGNVTDVPTKSGAIVADMRLDISLPVHDLWIAADALKHYTFPDTYTGKWQCKAIVEFSLNNSLVTRMQINRGDSPLDELMDIESSDYVPGANVSNQMQGGGQPSLLFQSTAAGPGTDKQSLLIAPIRLAAKADRVRMVAISHFNRNYSNTIDFLFGLQILSHPAPV